MKWIMGKLSEDAESVVDLFQWMYINPDHSADGQDALWTLLETVLSLGAHRVTHGREHGYAADTCIHASAARLGGGLLAVPSGGGAKRQAAAFSYVGRKPLHHTKLHLTGL